MATGEMKMGERVVSVVLFEGFELLDVFGPVELFFLTAGIRVEYLGPNLEPVVSSQGARVTPDRAYADCTNPDVLLVPGGIGTRKLVTDESFVQWLRRAGASAEIVASVCTGAGLLARAGLLEGRRATTNKLAFDWPSRQGTNITWVPQARWVVDGNRWTSSGVAAGMDMAHALIAQLSGQEAADKAATDAELEVHRDSSWDPFARIHGLA